MRDRETKRGRGRERKCRECEKEEERKKDRYLETKKERCMIQRNKG
jgi:hypothetical protein